MRLTKSGERAGIRNPVGGAIAELALGAPLVRRSVLRAQPWPKRTAAMLAFLRDLKPRRLITIWGRAQGLAFFEIDDQLSWLENEGYVDRTPEGYRARATRRPEAAILIGPEGGERVVPVPRVERPLVDPVEARDVG